MKKINLILLFIFLFISSSFTLNAYEVEKDKIVRIMTFIVEKDEPSFSIKNFSTKKGDKNNNKLSSKKGTSLDAAIEKFIEKIGYENIIDIKFSTGMGNIAVMLIYKEKRK